MTDDPVVGTSIERVRDAYLNAAFVKSTTNIGSDEGFLSIGSIVIIGASCEPWDGGCFAN